MRKLTEAERQILVALCFNEFEYNYCIDDAGPMMPESVTLGCPSYRGLCELEDLELLHSWKLQQLNLEESRKHFLQELAKQDNLYGFETLEQALAGKLVGESLLEEFQEDLLEGVTEDGKLLPSTHDHEELHKLTTITGRLLQDLPLLVQSPLLRTQLRRILDLAVSEQNLLGLQAGPTYKRLSD